MIFSYTKENGCKQISAVITNVMPVIVKKKCKYEGWNFNSGNYLFTTDTK